MLGDTDRIVILRAINKFPEGGSFCAAQIASMTGIRTSVVLSNLHWMEAEGFAAKIEQGRAANTASTLYAMTEEGRIAFGHF